MQTAAQPVQGVVWHVPEEPAQALQELDRLGEMGVQAVRTGLVADTTVLTRADSLGIALYQEVPIDYLPAAVLRDTLEAVQQQLRPVLQRASGHRSARHFGLARRSDTSDPAACAYFRALTELVQQEGPAGSATYYLTAFVENDRCTSAVDFVLLDALDEDDPARLLRRRAARSDSSARPVGVGAVGTYVRPAAGGGLRRPHSPERQARYLEQALGVLLADTLSAPPSAVFVYRWRDEARGLPLEPRGADLPTRRRYGLLAEDGSARPASDVVQGFYTGRQRVFAFSAGTEPGHRWPWLLLIGWGVVAALGVTYTLSTRMRRMAPRYFGARGFYRDAVREGRELMEGATTGLLVLVGISLGVACTAALSIAREHEVFWVVLRILPDGMHEAAFTLVTQPWLATLAVAAVFVGGVLLWAAALALLTRGRQRLLAAQTLVLIIWPRWTFLLVMVAALVVATLPPDEALALLPYLVGVYLVLHLYATARTLNDYRNVAFVPVPRVITVLALNPFMLGLLALGFALLQYRYEVAFLWHLLTRT